MSNNLVDTMPFAKLIGLIITEASKEGISGELLVRPDLCTAGGIMHGGAVMAIADAMGAIGAFLNLPDNAKGTTTIESKTNFLGAAPLDSTVSAESLPLHVGRRTSVWQTKINRADGKAVAIVTQTQMVL